MEHNRTLETIEPLPGDRQGVSGAGAGHDSMRDVGGRVLKRRAPVVQSATAQLNQREVDALVGNYQDDTTLPDGSPAISRAARRRENGKRMKWTRELNIDIMRSFYYVNQCQDQPLPGWRSSLHADFTRRHPDLQVSEQNVVDRKRVILKQEYGDNERNIFHRDEGIPEEQVDRTQQEAENQVPQDNENEVAKEKLAETFESLLAMYINTCPLERPAIPVLQNVRKAQGIIERVNAVLEAYTTPDKSLEYVHLALYCAAVTVVQHNGQSTYYPRAISYNRLDQIPAWRRRLEKTIDKLRGRADLIAEFLKDKPSKKVHQKVRTIAEGAKIYENQPNYLQKLIELQDTYRQKYKAKGARLSRFNATDKRKKQNNEFLKSQKQFFRKLENESAVQQDTAEVDVKAFGNYWSGVWAESERFNHDADWISTIEDKVLNVPRMVVNTFSKEDITAAIKKTQNWKTPGPDRIQNFWLKRFPAIHGALARCFTQALDDPHIFPEFLSNGNTVLLFKKGDP
ncbi:uncharacterized protein LOC115884488 [Sitophilus oryzae]|uniref:Uncharacterized protein LOC115884488 n=1 Tax=Sitophilus oryzae TaxID=7048 RepID=A0A6J2Y784_SITOR|nr:uncharacterized protein LOC115884488 [Sitophilus oryzae]